MSIFSPIDHFTYPESITSRGKNIINNDLIMALMIGEDTAYETQLDRDFRVRQGLAFDSLDNVIIQGRETFHAPQELVSHCATLLAKKGLSIENKQICLWLLGTTDKATRNSVLLQDAKRHMIEELDELNIRRGWKRLEQSASAACASSIRGSNKSKAGLEVEKKLVEQAGAIVGLQSSTSRQMEASDELLPYSFCWGFEGGGKRMLDGAFRLGDHLVLVEITTANKGNSEVTMDHADRVRNITQKYKGTYSKVSDMCITLESPKREDYDAMISLRGHNFPFALATALSRLNEDFTPDILSCHTRNAQDQFVRNWFSQQ